MTTVADNWLRDEARENAAPRFYEFHSYCVSCALPSLFCDSTQNAATVLWASAAAHLFLTFCMVGEINGLRRQQANHEAVIALW